MTTFASRRDDSPLLTRRALAASTAVFAGGAFAMAAGNRLGLARQGATPVAGTSPDEILAITRQAMDDLSLRATILRITIDGDEIVKAALGESMTGVPATADMHFRNGAVAISLISTLMLTLVDDGTIGLDDPIAPFMPDLPEADTATFRMLANMTAGYRDHVQNVAFLNLIQEDPYQAFTPDEIISYSLDQPRLFAPGTNWEYSHSNYFILGLAMEAATGLPVEQLMQERVLDPLGLANTVNSFTPEIPEPALQAFTSERRAWFGLAPGQRFYEDATYWNPSWTLTRGAVQTQDIVDFAETLVAVGDGTVLSPESSAAQLDRGLKGFGAPLDGCNSCRTLDDRYTYGLGVIFHGPWLIQNPLFYGESGISAWLPERRISIAVVNTYNEGAFDSDGNYPNSSGPLFDRLAAYLAPDLGTPVAGS